jgi:Holliday junction resolvasome RuvABC endonuclease subunit
LKILGIDPGSAHVGWCLLECGRPDELLSAAHQLRLADQGQWFVQCKGRHWAAALKEHIRIANALLEKLRPDVVGIEKVQVNHAPIIGGESNVAQARAQAAMTQRTAELVSELCTIAAGFGAKVKLVHPATGLARLGLKRGCTDGTISKAYNRMWGQTLKASEHHIARACGVALAAKEMHNA